MKKCLVGSLICLFIASGASAEIMMTAKPLGKGKCNLTLGAKYDQNYFDMGNISAMFVDTVQYGVNEKLDVYASTSLGFSQKATERPRTMDALTMFSASAGLKYALLLEDPKTERISLAVNAGLKASSVSKSTMNSWQYSVGILAGKRVNNFSPYAGINYRLTTQAYGDYSQVDYTLGTGIGPEERMLIIEDTLQVITFAGSTFTSNQIALGFAIGLN